MIIDQTELDRLIEQAESQLELDSIISTSALASRIINRAEIPHALVPWAKLHGKYDIRQGEVTIWAGENGSGKSLLVGQVMAHLIGQGAKVLIASMEMKPEETVSRLIAQCAGCAPSNKWVYDFCNWAEGRLYIYDQLDTVASDRILKMIRAVATELGVNHVVIDSLVKCGVAQDGQGYLTDQTRFLDKLQHLAKHLDIHIHLIAHTRKPERDGHRITKHDIRGASQITDLADNVILISRNRQKERAVNMQIAGQPVEDQSVLEEPDTFLTVAKQRHFSWEGGIGLDYRTDSGQFVRAGADRPMPWPDDSNREPWREDDGF